MPTVPYQHISQLAKSTITLRWHSSRYWWFIKGHRQWTDVGSLYTIFNSSIWYDGPWKAIGATGTDFWCVVPGTLLVQVIFNWPYILCDLHQSFIFHQAGDMFCFIGLRSAFFIIHGQSCRLDSPARCDIICFRRWHAALYPLQI